MSEIREAGWHADPTGRFTHRYFDGKSWTDHVSRDGSTASDPMAEPPVRTTLGTTPTATAPVAGTGAVVALPDSPERAQRRRTFGWVLLGAVGAVLLSMALPWVSGAEEYSQGTPETLAGHEFSIGSAVGFVALLLGVYGWQAVAKPRVRFHVAALVALVFMVVGTLFYFGFIEDADLQKLEVASEPGESGQILGGFIEFNTGGSRPDGPLDKADRVDAEAGITLAAVAELVAIWPLAVLWRDDRARRREAGLLM